MTGVSQILQDMNICLNFSHDKGCALQMLECLEKPNDKRL